MFKKIQLKSILLATALMPCLMSGQANAAAKIEVGEYQWVSVGAGIRGSYTSVEDGAPNGSDDSNSFNINSARLYISGQIHKYVKLTLNTFCDSCVFGSDAFDSAAAGDGEPDSAGDLEILDAIAQFELHPLFNVWAGRLLTPADRIELNGPYYALSWNQYNVPLLPSDGLGTAGLLGRDDGVLVWGGTDRVEYSFGVFDGLDGSATGANSEDNVLYAGRLEVNLLNKEASPAYYTASTYFGGNGDIFTLGLSFQHQSDFFGTPTNSGDFTSFILDGFFEKILPGGGVFNLEGEYKTFETDGLGANGDVDSYFVTVGYLFPQQVGIGKFQPYVRWVDNDFDVDTADSDALELGLNYRIKGYDAWLNFNYLTGDATVGGVSSGNDTDVITLGFQIQI